jgi:hypothetical protein
VKNKIKKKMVESEQNQFVNFIIIDQCYFMEFENKKKASEITL